MSDDVIINVSTDSVVPPEIVTTALYGPKGDKGDKGDTGNGISRISLTSSIGVVDTYTIYYTNGSTTSYEVVNGFEDKDKIIAVSDDLTNIDNVADDLTKIDTVANNISDVGDVADNILAISAVNSNATNINAVNSNKTNIDTVAGDISNINAVAGNATNINAVAGNATNINAVNSNATNINAVAGDLTNINAVAADLTNIDSASTYATNANIWAEGTDLQVQALGGVHSSKGWADVSAAGQVQADWAETDTTSKAYIQNKPDLKTVATSGSYEDLTNKPLINNATLTIQKNGVTAGTFTANSATDTTVDINETTYYAGTGISITPKLQTAVSVVCSNPNLTVTSSYDDTESTTGVTSYEFEYINGKIDKYPIATTHAERCALFILNGNLYHFPYTSYPSGTTPTWTMVDNSGNWTMVSGEPYTSGQNVQYAYAINGGKLYAVTYTPSIMQVGSSSNWTYVAGYSLSSSRYAYGINDGKLYRLSNTTTTQVGSDTTWTMVTSNGNSVYGLNNKKLYLISGTSAQKIGNLDWDIVSDGRTSYDVKCFGISDGKLYSIESTTVAQVGSDTGWTYVCGCALSTAKAYGIRNGTLYSIDGSSTVSSVKDNITKVIIYTDTRFCCLDTSGKIYYGNIDGSSTTSVLSSYSWDNIYTCDYGLLATREGGLYHVVPAYASMTLIGQIETSNGWNLDGSFVELNDYYLAATGTPELNDTIDLTYTTTEKPNEYTISATGGV